MTEQIKILWADDEIELLKPQLFFLEKKGYQIITVSNGHDALDVLEEDNQIDVAVSYTHLDVYKRQGLFY